MKISIASTDQDKESCFPVMVQLRTNQSKDDFLEQISRQEKAGYKLVFVEDKGKIVAVAGFRVTECLAYGKFLYIDDLITDSNNRSRGYGDRLFDWLVSYAKKEQCNELHLDSGVQRFDAHRFYLRKRLNITAHHFGLSLKTKK